MLRRRTQQKPPPLPKEQSLARRWKYLSPKELRGLKNLLFTARVAVEGAYAGRHKSPYKGSSSEFVDYREYHPGDEIRSIDWKAYARSDRYFVKLFEKETDMNCYLVLDSSASMGFGGKEYDRVFPTHELSKLEYACSLAASLAYLMIKQGDKVGLTIFDQRVQTHLPCGGTFPHLYALLNQLEIRRAGRKTSVSHALREIYGLCKRRGLLVLISDLLDDPESIFRALSLYTHRRFEIIVFHVLHKYEADLPPLESVDFIDSESSESVTTFPRDVAAAYRAQVRQFTDTMSALARARGIDYNLVNTEVPYSAVLEKYLLRRSSL
jgi:uncharacterized protein (DUF58 family)